MARYNHYFPAFLGGEVSPAILGRSDAESYNVSAQTIDNFIVQIQGGVARRPGFKYLSGAKVSTATRLIPFSHSNGTLYMLEFSDLAFRVFKNGVLQGAPTVVTTTYATADLAALDFAQSGDSLYIVHPSYVPRVVTRSSDTSWAIADVAFKCAPMYPVDHATYGRTNTLGNTAITVSSLSANTLGGSATLVMSGSLFSSADVGKFMRIKNFTADPDSEANATITTTQTKVAVISQNGDSTSYSSGPTLYAHVPDLYEYLPAITTTTRTTPYSTIVTTVDRTYSGSNGGTSAATPESASVGLTYSGAVKSDEEYTVTGNETESWGLVKITAYTSATTVIVTIVRPI
jgi:hypothetical protein